MIRTMLILTIFLLSLPALASSRCELALEMKTEFGRLAAAAQNSFLTVSILDRLINENPRQVLAGVPATTDNLPLLKALRKSLASGWTEAEKEDLHKIKIKRQGDQRTQHAAKEITQYILKPERVHRLEYRNGEYVEDIAWIERNGRAQLYALASQPGLNQRASGKVEAFPGGQISTLLARKLLPLSDEREKAGLFRQSPDGSLYALYRPEEDVELVSLPDEKILDSNKTDARVIHPFRVGAKMVIFTENMQQTVSHTIAGQNESTYWSRILTSAGNGREAWIMTKNQFDVPELVRWDGQKIHSEAFVEPYSRPDLFVDRDGRLLLHSSGWIGDNKVYVRQGQEKWKKFPFDKSAVRREFKPNSEGNPTLLYVEGKSFRLVEFVNGTPQVTNFDLQLRFFTDIADYSTFTLHDGRRYIVLARSEIEIYDMSTGALVGQFPFYARVGVQTLAMNDGQIYAAGISGQAIEIYALMGAVK